MLPQMYSPPSTPLLTLSLQPFRLLPLINSPNRALRLILPSLKIRTCQRNNTVDFLRRIDEIPCAEIGRGVWVDVFDCGVGEEGEVDLPLCRHRVQKLPVRIFLLEALAWGRFCLAFSFHGGADPDVAVAKVGIVLVWRLEFLIVS